MKLVATIKIKIPDNKMLNEMGNIFIKSVQYAIDKGFNTKISNRFQLHHLVYKDLRQWLPADFAIEAIGKACGNLKSTNKRPVLKSCPISFNRKLFTFDFNKVRITTFTKSKRQDIAIYVPRYYWKYLDWRYQTMEVITKNKKMFLNITFSREVNTLASCGNEILGVDLGINNLAVCSDGQVFKTPKTKIKQFQYLRSKLQAKGTKSAKRLLKKLSGKQKRFMAWVNHNVSKQIVSSADVIVLENLKGIRKQRKGKRFNRWLNNWSFFQLQQFISYKAEREGKTIDKVNPYLTSQTCSSCGKLGSRYFDFFNCPHCGLSLQSDFNASCNLRRLHITQPNVSDDEGKASIDDLRLSPGTIPLTSVSG